MKKGYFVIRANHWGQADNLYEAIRNCGLNAPCRFTESIRMIKAYHGNEEGLRGELELIDKYPEDYQDEGETDFQIVIWNKDKWKFSGADDIDGAPTFKWIGEGNKPEGKVPTVNISMTLDKGTGEMKIRKYEGGHDEANLKQGFY